MKDSVNADATGVGAGDGMTGTITGTAAYEYVVTGYTADGKEVSAANSGDATLYEATFEIANTLGVELPDNGSFGAIWFMLIGAALILFAALLLRRQYALARR